jgi:sialate O-acetylesterase
MVLQRDRPIHIWGWSDPGDAVSVSLNGATGSDTSDKYGRWSVYLPPLPAGGPYEVRVSGSNTITLEDVLVGDVWFASGQSNMEMPLKGFTGSAVINNSDAEINSATNPKMRLLLIPKKTSNYPLAGRARFLDRLHSGNRGRLFGGGVFLRPRYTE